MGASMPEQIQPWVPRLAAECSDEEYQAFISRLNCIPQDGIKPSSRDANLALAARPIIEKPE
jgi:hypothetical protein